MLRVFCALAAIAGLGFVPLVAAAQDLPVLKAKDDPPRIDRLSPAADVSAPRIVVGVMVDAPGAATAAPRLVVEVPEGWSGPVCGRLLSRDALYEGEAEFELTAESLGASAVLDAMMGPAHWQAVSGAGREGMAAAVTSGRCSDAAGAFAVAHWPDLAEADAVVLYVNSQNAQEVWASPLEDGVPLDTLACEPLDGGQGVGFDHACRLPVAGLPAGRFEVEINRVTMGSNEDPVYVAIETIPTR